MGRVERELQEIKSVRMNERRRSDIEVSLVLRENKRKSGQNRKNWKANDKQSKKGGREKR